MPNSSIEDPPARQVLVAAMEAGQVYKPARLAEMTGLQPGTVRTTLRDMLGRGEVQQSEYGAYSLPSTGGDGATQAPTGAAEEDPAPQLPVGAERATPAQLRRLGLTRVPRLSIEASAGPGYEVTVEAVDVDAAPFIISEHEARARYGVSASDLHTIPVRGDSMEPTLRAGDEALVARVYPGTPLRDGMIYTLGSPDGVLIKRLRFESEAVDDVTVRRFVWIVSDNKDAASYRVPVAVFERDYKVVAAFLTVLRSL